MDVTLYKLDSKGKIRLWRIYAEGATIVQEAGLLDGKLVINKKEATSKNEGKSNETTPEQQAISEIESSIKEQLRTGYCVTIQGAKNSEVVLPMLAHSYEGHKHKIDWNNCFIQPKLDGQRCLAFCKANGDVTLMSRDAKEILTMGHIKKELSAIKKDVILDGELYNLELGSFQEQMKAIKKYRPGVTEKINFNIYDVVDKAQSFNERFQYIQSLMSTFTSSVLKIHETIKVYNENQMIAHHKTYISQGYEGSIVRWGEESYKVNGRSANLLKYKDFKDMDVTIEDIIPSEQRPTWGQPIFSLKGKKFSAGMKYSHEDRVDFLVNKEKYIGKKAVLRYFELSDEGTPRFPVMVGIRND